MSSRDPRSNRRTDDHRLGELYDALIGSPGQIGALEEFRTEFKLSNKRMERLEGLYDSHLLQHKEDDEDADENQRTVRDVLLRLGERAVVALVASMMSVYVAAQTFLQNGHAPKP